jgi:hypothetical protein
LTPKRPIACFWQETVLMPEPRSTVAEKGIEARVQRNEESAEKDILSCVQLASSNPTKLAFQRPE